MKIHFRNHNSIENFDQDPVALGPEVVEASVKALRVRYSLLPYLYTLFVRAHLLGTPVARPVFLEFPEDRNTYDLGERQFMLGPAVMVAPILEEVMNIFRNHSFSIRISLSLLFTFSLIKFCLAVVVTKALLLYHTCRRKSIHFIL